MRVNRWRDRMKRLAIKMLDRDFDNLRAAHLWSIEHADVDAALRLVAGLREYSFRCMHAEITSWADAAIALPDAPEHERYPVAVGVAAYGRFIRGDLEGAIELGERAIAAADRLAVDSSGLAERALGNACFYKGEVDRGVEWMDRMIASARTRFAGSPGPCSLYAIGRLHQRWRQRERCAVCRQRSRRRRRFRISHGPGPGPLRPGSRPQIDEPDRRNRSAATSSRYRPRRWKPVDPSLRAYRSALA